MRGAGGMSVYVDPSAHPYGRMMMCHMWANTLDELLDMVDAIGVQRRWLQQPPKASWVHFDIAKGKRALAVQLGAIETDRFGPLEHEARAQIASGHALLVERGKKRLALVDQARARRGIT